MDRALASEAEDMSSTLIGKTNFISKRHTQQNKKSIGSIPIEATITASGPKAGKYVS